MKINKAGVWGEIYAARYLRDKGYRIITANYRCRIGEIDIIAQKGNSLCFVEVKARTDGAIAQPMESVDYFKQERIIAASQVFLREFKPIGQPQFDVCEVYFNANLKPDKINYIENAFGG